MTMSASNGQDGYNETGVKPTAGANLSPHDESFDPSEVYDNATGSNIFETSDREVELPKETGYRNTDEILEDFDSSEALSQAEESIEESVDDTNFGINYEGVDKIEGPAPETEAETASEAYDILSRTKDVVGAVEETITGLNNGYDGVEVSNYFTTESQSMEETYNSPGIIERFLG